MVAEFLCTSQNKKTEMIWFHSIKVITVIQIKFFVKNSWIGGHYKHNKHDHIIKIYCRKNFHEMQYPVTRKVFVVDLYVFYLRAVPSYQKRNKKIKDVSLQYELWRRLSFLCLKVRG